MFYAILGLIIKSLLIKIAIVAFFTLIGYGIGTLKVPESSSFEITRKTGGEKLDEVILKAIKFKAKKKRIYVYTKEENK